MQSIQKNEGVLLYGKYRRIFQSVISGQKDDEGAGKLMNPDYGISGGMPFSGRPFMVFPFEECQDGKEIR